MNTILIELGLVLAGILFALGLIGLLIRRNIIFILISIEVMLNAAGLAFIVVSSHLNQPDGQIMYFFILSSSAASVVVGLGLVLQMYHKFHTLEADAANNMRG